MPTVQFDGLDWEIEYSRSERGHSARKERRRRRQEKRKRIAERRAAQAVKRCGVVMEEFKREGIQFAEHLKARGQIGLLHLFQNEPRERRDLARLLGCSSHDDDVDCLVAQFLDTNYCDRTSISQIFGLIQWRDDFEKRQLPVVRAANHFLDRLRQLERANRLATLLDQHTATKHALSFVCRVHSCQTEGIAAYLRDENWGAERLTDGELRCLAAAEVRLKLQGNPLDKLLLLVVDDDDDDDGPESSEDATLERHYCALMAQATHL
ncbi:expressed unknown protein [Seminavis robusta]|uniref:Uncharacterized protein n=1 Tax=Seminavis robusta TaxID=568900 RepID=A0A9N8EAG9_9STRA|nr:expressed unknown protein [Seminavis robusta]|eukprot:Sro862_g212400.1 n/a (266) ;mRNA; r:8506-9412